MLGVKKFIFYFLGLLVLLTAYDTLGYTPEELLGTSIFEPIHPDDLQDVVQEFSRAMNSNTPGAATFRYRHKNGEWRWFEAIGKPFPTEQGESRTVIVSRDITERKKADDLLKARDEQTRLIIETAYDAFVAMDAGGLITARVLRSNGHRCQEH